MNNDSINIFDSSTENRVNIFSSPASQDVNIFSNNSRVPAYSNPNSIDIFSQQNEAEVNIFASVSPTIDIFSETSENINIFNDDAVEEQVNLFAVSDTSISSRFETLISDLNNEDLTNIASLVNIAKDIYTDGV